jgi:hypothetical protein
VTFAHAAKDQCIVVVLAISHNGLAVSQRGLAGSHLNLVRGLTLPAHLRIGQFRDPAQAWVRGIQAQWVHGVFSAERDRT